MKTRLIQLIIINLFTVAAVTAHAATTDATAQTTATTQTQTNAVEPNQKTGAAYMEQNSKKQGVVTLPSGLQYKIVEAGAGPKPGPNATVTVDYEGTLTNGKVFDSSYQRGQPITFPVSGVIAGWQEALQLMPKGSTWMLYIPANLAYGEAGAGGVIGPNEALVFKVHLIDIK